MVIGYTGHGSRVAALREHRQPVVSGAFDGAGAFISREAREQGTL
jgi:hypothetical protein